MSRNAILSSLFAIGCLALSLPAAGQPLAMTNGNGCDLWQRIDGGIELHQFGHVGTLLMERVGSDQRVHIDLECIDFPPEPQAEPDGIQQSVSICNWRMRENGVMGTNRAEVRWFPNPLNPGQFDYSANMQVIRGNRYTTGIVSSQGSVDVLAGTIDLQTFTTVFCQPIVEESP